MANQIRYLTAAGEVCCDGPRVSDLCSRCKERYEAGETPATESQVRAARARQPSRKATMKAAGREATCIDLMGVERKVCCLNLPDEPCQCASVNASTSSTASSKPKPLSATAARAIEAAKAIAKAKAAVRDKAKASAARRTTATRKGVTTMPVNKKLQARLLASVCQFTGLTEDEIAGMSTDEFMAAVRRAEAAGGVTAMSQRDDDPAERLRRDSPRVARLTEDDPANAKLAAAARRREVAERAVARAEHRRREIHYQSALGDARAATESSTPEPLNARTAALRRRAAEGGIESTSTRRTANPTTAPASSAGKPLNARTRALAARAARDRKGR